jgi:hypothetical protein
MSHITLTKSWLAPQFHGLRRPIALLGLIALLAICTLILTASRIVQTASPVPADVFMQSVVKRDGTLGWHQLCPALQTQVPLSEISNQAEAQRISEAGQRMTLTVDYVGAHPQLQGGQLRFYVVTAHWPAGRVEQRTYLVQTQGTGCVENVENLSLS